MARSSIVVRAETRSRDGLAACVGAARVVVSWRADQGAVLFLCRLLLERAHWRRRARRRHVCRTRLDNRAC